MSAGGRSAKKEAPVLALTSIPALIVLGLVLYLALGSFFTVDTAQAAERSKK